MYEATNSTIFNLTLNDTHNNVSNLVRKSTRLIFFFLSFFFRTRFCKTVRMSDTDINKLNLPWSSSRSLLGTPSASAL